MFVAVIITKIRKIYKVTDSTDFIMYEDVLRDIGLTTNEARVYEALLERGEASVQTISLNSKVHRRNVYDSLKKLIEKGLVCEAFFEGEKKFKIIDPQRLVEYLKDKEEKVKSILPQMEARFGVFKDNEEAYFYRGIEGFKSYLQDILKTKETVFFIGAKAFWMDPRLKHFLPKFQRERKKLGIKFKHLFDYEVKEEKPEILKLVGKPYKFLPKKYSSNTSVDVFGDYVVTFVGVNIGELGKEPIQFVLKSRKLADGYRKYFEFMWDHCKEE